MLKNVLIPTLLLASIITINCSQGAFAATSAAQTTTGTLGPTRQVVTNGGNISAVIDPTIGSLSASLTPGFTLITNSAGSQNVNLVAVANTTGGTVNALSGTGATGSTFIVLTNNAALPTTGAVSDAQSGAPTPGVNANVIAYPVNKPDDVPAQLAYTWDGANIRWNGVLTHKGNTNTLLTIPASTPKTNTFSIDDANGTYQATITLSFTSNT